MRVNEKRPTPGLGGGQEPGSNETENACNGIFLFNQVDQEVKCSIWICLELAPRLPESVSARKAQAFGIGMTLADRQL